jgi:ergothioneine biosynthesis protein EgtB
MLQQDVTATGASLAARFAAVRARSVALAAPLSAEDQAVQSMPDASPTKWHLAHTTWFFETFLLTPLLGGYSVFDPAFNYLFNSYYESVGERHPRAERGAITRPGQAEVLAYRTHVDAAMAGLLATGLSAEAQALIELGLNHEEQHQELILMDIKHVFSRNLLAPAYAPPEPAVIAEPQSGWSRLEGGLVQIGHDGDGFAFDNEGPRHKVWLEPFMIRDNLVTCGEWLAFMADGGYRDPRWWLADGWATVQAKGWRAPEYWRLTDKTWRVFTLTGERAVDPAEPVCHISFYEADAFARYSGVRLPTEAEWEIAAVASFDPGRSGHLHPRIGPTRQYAGQVWQWTASAYLPYPGYRAAEDPTGEYNGKFMSSQMVLRGGACVTPPGHGRMTYRNFFPPAARWAFSGMRLADNV